MTETNNSRDIIAGFETREVFMDVLKKKSGSFNC